MFFVSELRVLCSTVTECTLSKLADDTELGGVADTWGGCAAMQRA